MKSLTVVVFVVVASALLFAQAPASASGSVDTQPQATPDERPITGARNLGLGADPEHQNMLETSLAVSESGTSNARFASSGNDWTSVTSLSGNARLSRSTRSATTDLSYRGVGDFYSDNTGLNTHSHEFGMAETINLRRWTVMLADSLRYEPDGSYGSPIYGDIFNPDAADLRPGYAAGSGVLTPATSQLTNTGVAELQYSFSRKTTMTATGSYSLLRYMDSNLLDTNERTVGGGLNHSYGRNTVGLEYTNTMFRYESQARSMQTHAVEFSFARRMTRKYSFDIGAGPEVLVNKIHGIDKSQVLTSGHAAIRRQDGRTTESLTYSRRVSSGSGVTIGTKTDQIAAGVSHLYGRDLTLTGSAGYSRNQQILNSTTYNTVNATGAASKHLGRNASVSLAYLFQRQTSDGAFDHLKSHTVMFTFTWAFRPVRFK